MSNQAKISIIKLSDNNHNDFYPLASDQGVVITDEIPVNNILGGVDHFNTTTKQGIPIPAPDNVSAIPWNVHELLTRILGAEFPDIFYKDIDDSTLDDLTNDDKHVPTSALVKKLIQNILVANIDRDSLTDSYDYIPSSKLMRLILNGNGNLKFKILSYDVYQNLVTTGQIESDVLYFTWGGASQYLQVVFNGYGGTISINNQESFLLHMTNGDTLGEALANYGITGLPTAELEFYNFYGWYTDREAGVRVDEDYIPHANMTLYARWTTVDGDFLCLEEDYSVNILTEDLLYIRLEYYEDLEGILLATEGDHTLIVTEDDIYYISLAVSEDLYLVTEVDREPIVTEDKLYNISVLLPGYMVFATETNYNPIITEDRSYQLMNSVYDVSENLGGITTSAPQDSEQESNVTLLTASVPTNRTVQASTRNVTTLTVAKTPSIPVSSVSAGKSHITVMKVIFGEPDVIDNPKPSKVEKETTNTTENLAVFTPLPDNFTDTLLAASQPETESKEITEEVKPKKRRGRKRKTEVQS